MAVYTGTTGDTILDSYLGAIRSAEYGKDARSGMANAATRCYQLAINKVGGTQHGVTSANITEHTNRIKNAVYGEEVRNALDNVLRLVYTARGISVTSSENNFFTKLKNAQTGEDLKNYILMSIVQCYRDVMR